MGMPPRGQPLTATLWDICFLHWPVSESGVDERLPNWLSPDMADGSAWVSVVSAELRRIEVFGRPVRERVRVFLLRTYALSPARDRGTYVFAADLSDRPAADAVRRLLGFPCHAARFDRSTDGDEISIRARRRGASSGEFAATYEPTGSTQTASPDTLASFLTGRQRYFAEGPLGTRLDGSVGHDPLALRSARASVTEDSLLRSVVQDEFVSEDQPLAHYCDRATVQLEPPTPTGLFG